MLEDLNYYFKLAKTFREPTSNIMIKRIIIEQRFPALKASTRSDRLKLAIGRFLSENANAETKPGRRGR